MDLQSGSRKHLVNLGIGSTRNIESLLQAWFELTKYNQCSTNLGLMVIWSCRTLSLSYCSAR